MFKPKIPEGKYFLKSILCGAVAAIPYVFTSLWLFAWVALAPFFYLLLHHGCDLSKRAAYASGFGFGLGYFGVTYHWFTCLYPMDFAGIGKAKSALIVAVCWIGLTLLQAIETGFFVLAYRLIRPSAKRPAVCAMTFAALWVVLEWQEDIGWRGVPWARLALTQVKVPVMWQSASLLGGLFIGWMMALTSALVACAFDAALKKRAVMESSGVCGNSDSGSPGDACEVSCGNACGGVCEGSCGNTGENACVGVCESTCGGTNAECGKDCPCSASDEGRDDLKKNARNGKFPFWGAIKNKKTAIFCIIAAGIFLSNLLFGAIRLALYDEKGGTKVTAGVIQGNISSLEKWSDNAVTEALNTYIGLTRECVNESGADIVVWPETVIPVSLDRFPSVKNRISDTAESLGTTIFVGAFDEKYDAELDEWYDYNAIYVFYPDGSVGDMRYYKRRLVPFGEFTPMETVINTLLPVLAEMNILSSPLTPGDAPAVFTTDHGKVGSLICFDSIYQYLTVDTVRDGAELITLSTNDSWFRDSAAVRQHNAQAALRAVESGRYVVRAANTGISSVSTPEGKVLTEIEPLVKGQSYADVHLRSDRTLYSYLGNIIVYLCIAFLSAVTVFTRSNRKLSKDFAIRYARFFAAVSRRQRK